MKKQLILLLTFFTFSFIACKQGATQDAGNSAYADINVETFKAKISDPNTVVLDVRTPEEVAAGKIEGAVEMDFYADDFQQKVAALDKEKTYLVYCKSGGRSGKTCKMMEKSGFKSLYNLDGGWTAWSKN